MARNALIRIRRGTKAEHDALTGDQRLQLGELYHATDTDELIIGTSVIGTPEVYNLAGDGLDYLPLTGGTLTGALLTPGDESEITTTGSDAHIYTSGANAHIQTRSTFKLTNGTHVTTLSHAPTAHRAIAFPDAAGTVPTVPVFADLTAANAALDSGDFWWDSTLQKLRVATA